MAGKRERPAVAGRRAALRRAVWACLCALSLLAGAAGCGGGGKPNVVAEAVPTLVKAKVLDILNSRAKSTQTVRAKLSVKVRTAEMKRAESCEGSLFAQYPDCLRIRGQHDLLDYPPFDIGSDGTTWFVHSHFREHNEMHIGPTRLLDEYFDPKVPLRPADIVLAIGVGRLDEAPPERELFFTRHPGCYLISEVVTNASGRYVAKRITVDPDLIVITRLETFRPDGAIDMVAETTFDRKASPAQRVPATATIRLLRKDAFLLELKLRERQPGVSLPEKAFLVPDVEDIPNVYRHDSQ